MKLCARCMSRPKHAGHNLCFACLTTCRQCRKAPCRFGRTYCRSCRSEMTRNAKLAKQSPRKRSCIICGREHNNSKSRRCDEHAHTCGKCGIRDAAPGQRYCRLCAKRYMRQWRNGQPYTEADARKASCQAKTRYLILTGEIEKTACRYPGCRNDHTIAMHLNYEDPRAVVFFCLPHFRRVKRSEADRAGWFLDNFRKLLTEGERAAIRAARSQSEALDRS